MNEIIDNMKNRLSDVATLLTWREIAQTYFGKSSSWLYHKLNGIDGKGEPSGFTPEESERLRRALYDVAERIRKAADRI